MPARYRPHTSTTERLSTQVVVTLRPLVVQHVYTWSYTRISPHPAPTDLNQPRTTLTPNPGPTTRFCSGNDLSCRTGSPREGEANHKLDAPGIELETLAGSNDAMLGS